MGAEVPTITISGFTAMSSAMLPPGTPDACSCWKDQEFKKAKRLLRYGSKVQCVDATAYAALTSLALDMLMHGKTVQAEIVKGWV